MRNAMLTLKTTLKTATSGTVGSILKPALFAVLMWTASAAGAVPIPGTPVPITLQTFVVMLAALMLPWKQAGAAMLMYLAAGAVGLPVFAGGASTMALVGPSAGFLIGFLPAAIVTSLLKGEARTDSLKHGALTAARYLFACVAGCIALDYLLGFIVQSAITGIARQLWPWLPWDRRRRCGQGRYRFRRGRRSCQAEVRLRQISAIKYFFTLLSTPTSAVPHPEPIRLPDP